MLKKIRYFVSIFVIVSIVMLIGGPSLYALIFWNRLSGADQKTRIRRVSLWQMWWGNALLTLLFSMLGVKATFDLPVWKKGRPRPPPLIVIGNHRGSIDALFLPAILKRIGIDMMPVAAKKEFRTIPFVGRSAAETCSAFLERKGNPRDLENMRRLAHTVKETGASVVIFPEGTILLNKKDRGGYENILKPKVKGLKILTEILPDYDVLSVTIYWGDLERASDIRDSATLVGRRVHVEAEVITGPRGQDVAEWLQAEWQRKDRKMKTYRAKAQGL